MKNFKSQHLSYSSITLWERCPREWWLKYKYNIAFGSSPELAFGTAIHETIQEGLIKQDLQQESITRFTSKLLHQLVNNKLMLKEDAKNTLLLTGHRILTDPNILFMLDGIKVSNPENIERKITFNVPGVDLPVIGYIDIIDDDGHPYDIKTAKYDWSEDRIHTSMQPDFYLAGLEEMGIPHTANEFSYFIIVKHEYDPYAHLTKTVREGSRDRVFTAVQNMWEGVQREAWNPRVEIDLCESCKLRNACLQLTD